MDISYQLFFGALALFGFTFGLAALTWIPEIKNLRKELDELKEKLRLKE